jgi:hypothetical protein
MWIELIWCAVLYEKKTCSIAFVEYFCGKAYYVTLRFINKWSRAEVRHIWRQLCVSVAPWGTKSFQKHKVLLSRSYVWRTCNITLPPIQTSLGRVNIITPQVNSTSKRYFLHHRWPCAMKLAPWNVSKFWELHRKEIRPFFYSSCSKIVITLAIGRNESVQCVT